GSRSGGAGRRRQVDHRNDGGVIGEAIILVENTAVDRVTAIVVDGERRRGNAPGRCVRAGQVGGREGEAGVVAGRGVRRRGVGGVGEGDGRGAGFVDRPAVCEGRGRGDIIDDHCRLIIRVTVVLVEDPAKDRVAAVVVEGERCRGGRTG